MFRFLILSLYLSGFVYIAHKITSGLNLVNPYKTFFMIFSLILGFFSLLIFLMKGNIDGYTGYNFLIYIGYLIIGCWGIFITFFILNDLINLTNLIFKIEKFRYYSTLITIIVSFVCVVWSYINANAFLKINEVSVKTENLHIDKLKIVQLSDIHIDAFTKPKSVNKIFDKVISLKPDLIVITGDVLDTDILKDDKYKQFNFKKLKASYGVYAVSGNHENYLGREIFYQLCKLCDITVLKNESVFINNINIAGIDDINSKNKNLIEDVINQCKTNYPIIFLCHRPEPFNIVSNKNKKVIQLSGHTHAGQIPPIEIARNLMKYNYGIYENKGSKMYVSCGTRWWGPPMRFLNKCEIAVITLVK